MQLAIVTGTSKGLGFSITKNLLAQGIHIIGISRTENETLQLMAKEHGVSYKHLSYDLGNMSHIKQSFQDLNDYINNHSVKKLYLVNNAAVLQPINHSREINLDDLAFHIQVNTTAPLGLMNESLRISAEKNIPFYGVNITSGAAERAIYGWSAYCSTKALINRYTETVALEQETLNTGNKVFAFSPGVMDTNMQAEIRSSDPSAFKDVEQFKQYKAENQLQQTDVVGEVVVNILTEVSKIENGKVYYISDYL